MALTNAGRNFISDGIVGVTTIPFNNANARIGVGDNSGTFAATQVDLQASTNKFRRVMESGYPTIAINVLTFRSVFATTEANFVWEEWGVFNGSSATGTMLNRKVESLGTKLSSQSWQITTTLTVNAA